MDLPSLKPEAKIPKDAELQEGGAFGMHDTMVNGFTSVRSQICTAHPLAATEKNYKANAEQMRMAVLRSTQGIHAPLRLMFEKKAVSQVKRLPFLHSSNLALETLEGLDETVGVEDFLNDPEDGIEALATPHMIMEKHLHLF